MDGWYGTGVLEGDGQQYTSTAKGKCCLGLRFEIASVKLTSEVLSEVQINVLAHTPTYCHLAQHMQPDMTDIEDRFCLKLKELLRNLKKRLLVSRKLCIT